MNENILTSDINNKLYNYRLQTLLAMNADLNQQLNHPKIMAIRHLPLIFCIFLIMCLILIFASLDVDNNPTQKILLDKFYTLISGLTIIIGGVYLLTLRMEYKKRFDFKNQYEDKLDELSQLI